MSAVEYKYASILVNMLATFWSTPWSEQLECVLSSDHTLVGSKISTVEDAALAATAFVILAGLQKRRPRRVYVWPYSKVREKYRASDPLYQKIKPKMLGIHYLAAFTPKLATCYQILKCYCNLLLDFTKFIVTIFRYQNMSLTKITDEVRGGGLLVACR